MNEKMFDALETCLQALDNGETVDSALKRFPALADELRPILEASLHAKAMAGEAVAEDVHRRGRAKVLQHAAQMREAKRAPRQRTWIFAMRPVAVTLMLVIFLLSGTSLVRASSTALPGDNLYPVKRTWEDVTLMFVSALERADLELSYETERVEEIQELLAKGRNEVVTFSGYVNTQTPSQWTVAGVPVLITTDTTMPAEQINVGMGVTVSGRTNELGFLVAESVTIVPPGEVIPEIDDDEDEGLFEDDDDDDENENSGGMNPFATGGSGNSSGDDANESEDESKEFGTKLKGTLEATDGKYWVVNGQNVDVSGAEIVGTPAAGAEVVIEGYYNENGIFIATKVVFSSSGGSGDSDGNSSGGDSNDDNDSNDNDSNDNDDNDNDSNDNDDNENDDSEENDNGDDGNING